MSQRESVIVHLDKLGNGHCDLKMSYGSYLKAQLLNLSPISLLKIKMDIEDEESAFKFFCDGDPFRNESNFSSKLRDFWMALLQYCSKEEDLHKIRRFIISSFKLYSRVFNEDKLNYALSEARITRNRDLWVFSHPHFLESTIFILRTHPFNLESCFSFEAIKIKDLLLNYRLYEEGERVIANNNLLDKSNTFYYSNNLVDSYNTKYQSTTLKAYDILMKKV